MRRVRARLLQWAFQLLYSRLSGLHESAGWVAFGGAWAGRRLHVLPPVGDGVLLDLGCGEGRLLKVAARQAHSAVGLDPSIAMARRARRRGCRVVRGTSQSLPFRSASFTTVVATYPGSWILDAGTWDEIARVTLAGGEVRVLLGGTITRGAFSRFRHLLQRAVYGRQQNGRPTEDLPSLGNTLIVGDYERVADAWGEALIWRGRRDRRIA